MQLSKATIALQLKKFERHPNAAKSRFEVDVLIAAFERACTSNDMIEQVGEYLMRKLRFAPLPIDIYEAVEAIDRANVLAMARQLMDDSSASKDARVFASEVLRVFGDAS